MIAEKAITEYGSRRPTLVAESIANGTGVPDDEAPMLGAEVAMIDERFDAIRRLLVEATGSSFDVFAEFAFDVHRLADAEIVKTAKALRTKVVKLRAETDKLRRPMAALGWAYGPAMGFSADHPTELEALYSPRQSRCSIDSLCRQRHRRWPDERRRVPRNPPGAPAVLPAKVDPAVQRESEIAEMARRTSENERRTEALLAGHAAADRAARREALVGIDQSEVGDVLSGPVDVDPSEWLREPGFSAIDRRRVRHSGSLGF